MEIAYIYLCNACECLGFEILTGISHFHKEKTLGEQIHDKKKYSEFRCMHCQAPKTMLKTVRHVHKKEMIDLYNELEEQRDACLRQGKSIELHA